MLGKDEGLSLTIILGDDDGTELGDVEMDAVGDCVDF